MFLTAAQKVSNETLQSPTSKTMKTCANKMEENERQARKWPNSEKLIFEKNSFKDLKRYT